MLPPVEPALLITLGALGGAAAFAHLASPKWAAFAGGVVLHMALVQAFLAASFVKSLAVVAPVNLIPLFILGVFTTSAAFMLGVIATIKWGERHLYLPLALSAALLANKAPAVEALQTYGVDVTYLGYVAYGMLLAASASAVSHNLALRLPSAYPLAFAVAALLGNLAYAATPNLLSSEGLLYYMFTTANLYSFNSAMMVYLGFRNNVAALGKMGGFKSTKFWLYLLLGNLAYGLVEVLFMIKNPQVHDLLHR